jgi:hypothetical protein
LFTFYSFVLQIIPEKYIKLIPAISAVYFAIIIAELITGTIMAEIINIGDSYYKEIEVTSEIDGEQEPVDLSIYDDNYVAIKDSRETPDTSAYIFKPIPVKGNPSDGTLVLNLTPEETELLPATSSNGSPYLYVFVQIGSSVTGQIHEVSFFKVKTRVGGIHHITEVDKSYDMGMVDEITGWIFDAGQLCDQTTEIVDFDTVSGGILVYNAGALTNRDIVIYDTGILDLSMPETIDLGIMRECITTSPL